MAATNIAANLKEIGLGDLLIESPKSLLFTTEKELENIVPDLNEVDFFIVASTHRSEAKKKTFSVHPSGNFGNAELGGRQNELSFTFPSALKIGLQSIAKQNFPEFEIAMEVTHHGPTDWEKPLIFIEIGSTETEWVRKDCGKIIANAIKEIYETHNAKRTTHHENYIGFGGIHYAPSFTKIQIEDENIATGHIMPRYSADFLNREIVKQMLEKSFAKKALIDWKGLKSEARNKVIGILDGLGIEYSKTSDF